VPEIKKNESGLGKVVFRDGKSVDLSAVSSSGAIARVARESRALSFSSRDPISSLDLRHAAGLSLGRLV